MDFRDYDTRLGAYAVVVEDETVLLTWLNEPPIEPQWTLPGGGVELDETVQGGVVREVREETGYELELGRILGISSVVVPAAERLLPSDRPLRSVRVLFEGTIVGGELRHEVGGTTDEARWIGLDELASLRRSDLVDTALALRSSEVV